MTREKRKPRSDVAEQRKLAMRRATTAKTMVRNYAPGETVRKARPIQCSECCDQPWRRVDELCRPGPCFRCGMPYQDEQRSA